MFEETNDQSSIVWILVGLIVLVLAGVFFSLMVDKRFKFSSQRVSIKETVAKEAQELEKLREQAAFVRDRWQKESAPVSGQGDELARLAAKVAATETRLPDLRQRKDELEAGLEAVTKDFRSYQNRYRSQMRADATGETLDKLRTVGGRTYEQVTVRRVTSAGIEITHAHGITRLQPKDLDASWHERFQWDQEEVEKVLELERTREERHRKAVARSGRPPDAPKTAGSVAKQAKQRDREMLAALRRDLIDARSRMNEADSELARVRMEAQTSRGRSVPGSLETWGEVARRLEGVAKKRREQYGVARSRLAAVAPGDGLLREPTQ